MGERWTKALESGTYSYLSLGPEVVAELAAEFRSEQDYLGECNKNRLLAAVAHAAIRRRSAKGIRAWMSRSEGLYPMAKLVVEQTPVSI
ncbi:hypothetical protein Q3G72_020570 [Acer saccharum]|nr:hypothetical protein Q3G72_020570 [Acer saccharum]